MCPRVSQITLTAFPLLLLQYLQQSTCLCEQTLVFTFLDHLETAPSTKSESKPSAMLHTATTPSRLRTNHSKPRESSNPEGANNVNGNAIAAVSTPGPKARAKLTSPDVKTDIRKTRRSLLLNRTKSGEEALGSQKGRELEDARVVGRCVSRPVVEQFARPRRSISRKNEEVITDEKKKKELEEKLELNDAVVKDLQSQVLTLKADLHEVQNLNAELQSQNKKLAQDLAAAEAKIAALTSSDQEPVGEYQSPKFEDIQKLISNKLEHSVVKKEINEQKLVKTLSAPQRPSRSSNLPNVNADRRAPACPSVTAVPAPPPPPPPPLPVRAASTQKSSQVVHLHHLLMKQEGKRDPPAPGNHNKPAVMSAHSSIVGEIQNRSAHLLAIKADIQTKGDFINGLICKVLDAAYTDIEHVLKFVDWLDGELASLADERAVLKHFKWPERKADAMREAAIEYRDLKMLESEIFSHSDDPSIPCGTALKKMAGLLDKSERSIQRLIKLRNSVLSSYKEFNIPIDWMLDSGVMSKIKQGSVKLARTYMKRVMMEFEQARNLERESIQEALLLQGVHFAYRAHQFAGGLDSETLCAFEEIRQHVPGHLGGSRELLAGIPSW